MSPDKPFEILLADVIDVDIDVWQEDTKGIMGTHQTIEYEDSEDVLETI